MRSRRRRPRVVWLPTPGTLKSSGLAVGQQYMGGFFIGQIALGGNNEQTVEFPIVTDNPSSRIRSNLANWQGGDLATTEEHGYRLRRVVGKVHVGVGNASQAQPATRSNFVAVTAGLIVRRVDEQTGLALAGPEQVDVQAIANASDPWIWRRTWLIATGVFAAAGDVHNANDLWPRNNVTGVGAGSFDASHVDARTARIVGPEERLFLNVSFTSGLQLDGQDEAEETVNVSIHHDLRALGTLRINQGNRRNASR